MRSSLLIVAIGALLGVGAAAGGSAPPAVVARIATGLNPGGAAAAFGAVWVANDRSGTLARIDPRSNRVVARVRVGRGAFLVAAGAGGLWVSNYEDGSVARVDPRTLRVRRVRVGGEPGDPLVAFGRVWVTAWEDGTLVAIDPRTLRVVRRLEVGPHPTGVTAAAGAVWVGFGRDATAIARVDPATGSIERVPVGVRAPSGFVEGAPDLWVAANGGDLLHVDPATGRVLAHLHVGRTFAEGAVAPGGTIWLPDKEQSIVYRIDPEREAVIDSFRAGRGAFEAVRAFGSMWVTSYAGRDVWRFRP